MAIGTYDELKAALASWLARDDLEARLPEFVALAEARLSRVLATRQMEAVASAQTAAGSASLALPGDYGQARLVRLMVTPPLSLQQLTPAQLERQYRGRSGRPQSFAVIGGAFRLAPVPDTAYTIEIAYERTLPALGAANPQNWLLSSHPDAYLFAALAQAEGYLMNDARAAAWEARLQASLAELETRDALARWSGGEPRTQADICPA